MRRIVFAIMFFLLILLSVNVNALDNSAYYGDGVSVSFSDIRISLPALYRNTPTITVHTKSGAKSYPFNVEMYIDKGFLIYGDPFSTVDLGYTNSFKTKTNGYFYASGQGSSRGEYRYLGLSINGTVYTNTAFPSDEIPGTHEYVVVKYSSLPEYLKQTYGITKDGNLYFEGIRDLIDSPNSPVWDFTYNYTDGSKATVYDKFKASGLVGNYVVTASIFDYVRITSWGSGGGSVVLYYQSINDNSVYRYATFVGNVSPAFAKGFLGLKCDVLFGKDNYKIDNESDFVNVDFKIVGTFTDNYRNMSDILKRYTYTRDDVLSYMLYNQNLLINTADVKLYDENVVYSSNYITKTLYRESLSVGYNIVNILGTAKVNAENCIFSSDCTRNLLVYVEPKATHLPTPSASINPTPNPTPDIRMPTIKRKW